MNQWENVMQKNAKSFYLASLFFPRVIFRKVKALYALCRWLDDAVDEAPNKEVAEQRLDQIATDLSSDAPQMVVNQLYRKSDMDVGYIKDLIEGARDDLKTVRIKNEEEFIQYCYKVAGTVGLAMFDLMKVSPAKARANAVDLGIAMQITNICRDVLEDSKRNRVYLPETLLQQHGISGEQIISGSVCQLKLSKVTMHLIDLADVYYQSAAKAFRFIPFRARGPVIIAALLYRGIGQKLKKRGGNPMLGRIYLSFFEKLPLLLLGLGTWMLSGLQGKSLEHDGQLHQALKPWQSLRGFS